jgi:hypothetical protein
VRPDAAGRDDEVGVDEAAMEPDRRAVGGGAEGDEVGVGVTVVVDDARVREEVRGEVERGEIGRAVRAGGDRECPRDGGEARPTT